MGIRIGSGLSTEADARFGAAEAAAAARDALGGRECDLAVVFASGAHLAAPEATLEGIHETLAPAELVGCGAAGVIGEMREVEQGTAVSVWAAALDGGEAMPFHAEVEALGSGEGVLSGLPDLTGAAGALLLADPFTFATDAVLRELSTAAPMLPLLGGLASARSPDAETPLLFGEDVLTSRGRRRPLRRRRDPALRLPGRHPDRPGADDHRLRGSDHRRARRPPGAREAA